MFRNLRVNSVFFRPKLLFRFQSNAYENPKTSMLLEIRDHPGSLTEALKYFWKYDINLTHIESRPSKKDNQSFEFLVDFVEEKADQKVQKLIEDLSKLTVRMFILDGREVPWFPRHSSELDSIAHRVLDAGIDLQADHPGFKDPNYRARRSDLASVALNYRAGNPIPNVDYIQTEIETWGAVYDRMVDLHKKFACKEYLEIFPLMEKECGYARNNIPQQEDISQFLQKRTGFQLRPVAGLLSSRDFLNGLAFRVFFSTQYIRHHSVPLYTPEPDICHELIGHAPMFADSDFADFSQEIGLASLGASDEEIEKLARCYWYSVEFGVTQENGQIKAYGAGLLSSFGELEYACAPYRPAGDVNYYPQVKPWEPDIAARLPFPITTYQPVYFLADSLHDAKEKMRLYCEQMKKPFHARYNPLSQIIWVDRAVKVNKNEKK